MKRIPVAKLIRGKAEAIVYCDDYWDDIESDNPPSDIPDPLPKYGIEGDDDLVSEFEDFVSQNGKLLREYAPMPWSIAGRLSGAFAKEKNIDREYILPKEYKERSHINKKPNICY
jgi:hypothetical protein